MGKTLLIKVPYLQIFEAMQKTAAKYFPLGLGYISSYMKSKGHDALILDPEMQGLSEQDIEAIIEKEKPNIIGLSSATPNFSMACKMAKRLKAVSDAVIVYGGIHASTFQERIIEGHAEFDILVYGEGEETMVELEETLERSGMIPEELKKIRLLKPS